MKKLVAIIIIVGIGYLAYQFLVMPQSDREKPTSSSNQIGGSSIPVDWKTFASTEKRFSLRYPPAWEIQEVEDGIYVVLTKPGERLDEAPISIDMSGSLPYERAVEEIQKDLNAPKQVAAEVGGLKGVEISGAALGETAEGSQYAIFTMLDDAGRLVSLDYVERGNEDSEMRRMYRLMVSSLVFTRGPI